MAKKTVTLETKKSAGLILVVRIDGTKLQLDEDGNGECDLTGGVAHVLDFFVRGQPGGTYKVAITAPSESRLRREAVLDQDQLDIGHAYFFVKA